MDSNDPKNPRVVLLLRMTVYDAALTLVPIPDAFELDAMAPGTSETQRYNIYNFHAAALSWYVPGCASGASEMNASSWLVVRPCSGQVAAGAMTPVALLVSAGTTVGTFSAKFDIVCQISSWSVKVAKTVVAAVEQFSLAPGATKMQFPSSISAGQEFSLQVTPTDVHGNEIRAEGLELEPVLLCTSQDSSRSWNSPAKLIFDKKLQKYRVSSRVKAASSCEVKILARDKRNSSAPKRAVFSSRASVNAVPCGAGTVNNAAGDRCICARGYELSTGFHCTACAAGRVKETQGDGEKCRRCGGERTTFGERANATSSCKCKDGYYDPSLYTVQCAHENENQEVCDDALAATADSSTCVECPPCANCRLASNGITLSAPRAGYWRLNRSSMRPQLKFNVTTTHMLYRCEHNGCVCGSGGCTQPSCASGYQGVACGTCALGYFMHHRTCFECSASANVLHALLFLLILMILLAVALCEGRRATLLGILISYVQTCALVALAIRWRGNALFFHSTLALSLGSSIGSLACIVPMWTVQLTVLLSVVTLSLHRPHCLRERSAAVGFRLAFVLFPGACLNAARILDCVSFEDLRVSRADMGWSCDSTSHRVYTFAAYGFLVLCVLLPILAWYHTWWALAKLGNDDGEARQQRMLAPLRYMFVRDDAGRAKEAKKVAELGEVMGQNTQNMYWRAEMAWFHWHLIAMARQTLLVSALVGIRNFPLERTLAALIVLLFGWCLHAFYSPFATFAENTAELAFNIAVYVLACVGLAVTASVLGAYEQLAANICVLCIVAAAVWTVSLMSMKRCQDRCDMFETWYMTATELEEKALAEKANATNPFGSQLRSRMRSQKSELMEIEPEDLLHNIKRLRAENSALRAAAAASVEVCEPARI